MHQGVSGVENSYRAEVYRKAIHLCSLLIPILYFFLNRNDALTILIPLTFIVVAVDIARYYSASLRHVFIQTFGWLLRKHELDENQKRLNGASYVLLSAIICVLLFPKIITISSFAVLIISDLTAALIGIRFGKHRFFSKSLEGSLAFFLSGIIVILLSPKVESHFIEYIIGFAAVLVGTFIEALPTRVDDNLSIPLSVGLTMWALYLLFLPAMNIYLLG